MLLAKNNYDRDAATGDDGDDVGSLLHTDAHCPEA